MAAADLFEGYADLVQLVVPAGIGPVILADPDDHIVLATAGARAAPSRYRFVMSHDTPPAAGT